MVEAHLQKLVKKTAYALRFATTGQAYGYRAE